jgi:hypothetical protein
VWPSTKTAGIVEGMTAAGVLVFVIAAIAVVGGVLLIAAIASMAKSSNH